MSQIDPQTEMFMGLFALIAIVDGCWFLVSSEIS